MKIKSKLIISYAVMLATVLAMAGVSTWAIAGWGNAAAQLSATYARGMLAERLRANMTRQINYGRDFIYGDPSSREEFLNARDVTSGILDELKGLASSQDEQDHIKGLEETHIELVWVMERLFENAGQLNSVDARSRLREISDEVADDVAALNQYYRAQENRKIVSAQGAGAIATAVIAAAAILGVIQLVTLIFLLQRWLAYPIATFEGAARKISAGDLDSRVTAGGDDEWGELARAINGMAQSLKASRQKLLLQERLAALGEIASFTAHNLRNPLAGIRAAAQVALCEPGNAQPETAESLRDIIGAVDRMDEWIKRFLDYARPLHLEIERQDINSLVAQATTMAQRPFINKSRLDLRLSDGLPAAPVDGVLIEQAVQVIAVNAFQALEDGGTVMVETHQMANADGQSWATIIITDDGRGIPPHIAPKLFKPFTSSKEGGTGLGLAQARKIVSAHGGEIDLESLQRGTRVTIRLPLTAEHKILADD